MRPDWSVTRKFFTKVCDERPRSYSEHYFQSVKPRNSPPLLSLCQYWCQNCSLFKVLIQWLLKSRFYQCHSFLLDPVIFYFKSSIPVVHVIKYVTDDAASQYKNYKNFTNLLHHGDDFKMRADEWYFFAKSHVKGPYDYIGGTTKRLAYRYSLQGGNIQTHLALYQWAS